MSTFFPQALGVRQGIIIWHTVLYGQLLATKVSLGDSLKKSLGKKNSPIYSMPSGPHECLL